MIDVLKRLAELDAANPNRPEYKIDSQQNISTTVNESTEVAECGVMGSMGASSSPASVTMTAASGDELGDLIRSIASLSQGGHSVDHQEQPDALSATPAMAMTSPDGMDMRSVIDKLNPMDDDDREMDGNDDMERKADEAYDNTPSDPTDTNEFDAEQHAHHENPPGAARGRGQLNHPIANVTYESLMAEYEKFISEGQGVA